MLLINLIKRNQVQCLHQQLEILLTAEVKILYHIFSISPVKNTE
jgi:hypothetical protein